MANWRQVRTLTESCMQLLRCHSNKQHRLRLKASQTPFISFSLFLLLTLRLWAQLFCQQGEPTSEGMGGVAQVSVLGKRESCVETPSRRASPQTSKQRVTRVKEMEACCGVWCGRQGVMDGNMYAVMMRRKSAELKMKLKWFKWRCSKW